MSNDPFAPSNSAPSDPWNDSSPAPSAPSSSSPVQVDVKDRFSIKLTLKAAPGHDAEWINPWVSGATAEEAARNTIAMLQALADYGVIEAVTNAAQFTRGQFKGSSGGGQRNGGGGGYQRGGGQQNNTPPPGTETKTCQHGEMVFRAGNGARGPYRAFFCPTPQGAPDKCKPIFLGN